MQRAWIQEGKSRAIIKWGNSQLVQEKRADVASGVIRNVSIGYSIDKMDENEKGEMVATRWTGLEISLVSVASDPHVGIGRSHPTYSTPKEETQQMSNYVLDGLQAQLKEVNLNRKLPSFQLLKLFKLKHLVTDQTLEESVRFTKNSLVNMVSVQQMVF